METLGIDMDVKQAKELYQSYKAHQHYSEPIDWEVQRTYQLIAQGKVIIKALESIRNAGTGDDNLPRLAIVRADAHQCHLEYHHDGSATMSFKDSRWSERAGIRQRVDFGANSFPRIRQGVHAEALAPMIPLHLRPKRGLENYHILFEAEWRRVVPKDPMLLRRIGKGDLWLVCAHWDLTEVERAALTARIRL